VLGGTALTGCAVAALALAGSFPVALAVMTLAGLAAGPAFASLFTVRQEWSPPELRGQIFTTAASAKIAAFAVGSALAGPVAGAIGVDATIAVTGAGQLLSVLAGLAAGGGPPGLGVLARPGPGALAGAQLVRAHPVRVAAGVLLLERQGALGVRLERLVGPAEERVRPGLVEVPELALEVLVTQVTWGNADVRHARSPPLVRDQQTVANLSAGPGR
jgi:MFS family permease